MIGLYVFNSGSDFTSAQSLRSGAFLFQKESSYFIVDVCLSKQPPFAGVK